MVSALARFVYSGARRLYTVRAKPYHDSRMFVAVVCEFAVDDHRNAAFDLLAQYGFTKVLKGAFETTSMSEAALSRLKRDLDAIADSYDSLRLYQYPVDGTLAITVLKEKKWRRLIVKA